MSKRQKKIMIEKADRYERTLKEITYTYSRGTRAYKMAKAALEEMK